MCYIIGNGKIIAAANISSIDYSRLRNNTSLGISVLRQYHFQGVGIMLIDELIKQHLQYP